MKLSNGVKIYCKSMGKIFRVSHIARGIDETNNFLKKHPDCGLIAEDENGLFYIADRYQITVKSNILPD